MVSSEVSRVFLALLVIKMSVNPSEGRTLQVNKPSDAIKNIYASSETLSSNMAESQSVVHSCLHKLSQVIVQSRFGINALNSDKSHDWVSFWCN